MERCANEWVNKKFLKASKTTIRKKLCNAEWAYELVANRVKHEEELEMIRQCGIIVHRLQNIIQEMTAEEMLLKSASGKDLIDLVLLGKSAR